MAGNDSCSLSVAERFVTILGVMTMLPSVASTFRTSQPGGVQLPASARDAGLTSLDQLARHLAEREAELRLITELLPVYILRADARLRYRFVNPAYARRFGREPAELVSCSIEETIGEQAFAATKPYLDQLLAGSSVQYEASIPYEGLGSRFMRSSNVPEFDEQGRVTGFVGVLIDLSDRRQTEQALIESEARFRTMADNISQLAWMADERGWVFWYNQRWFEYTGTTLDQMQGWGWTAVHHPDHLDRVVRRIQASWDSGEVWEDTFPLRGKDGEYRWFLSRALPVHDGSGRIVRWFGTNTDITERRRAEEALREADRRKDEFIALLAHELRNPLAPLRHGLEIQRLAGSDLTALEQARTMMERQVNHMVRLVDDLLDVSRISSGKLVLRKSRVDVRDAIRNALETVEPTMRASRHEVRVGLPAEPLCVEADSVRLIQVFSNLLNNAARYTPAEGAISVSAVREGDAVIVSVSDNGIGISPEMLQQVFDPFTQIRPAGESAQGGLGLGLPLARSLVQMHGGSIAATSAGLGQGARFDVRLPLDVEGLPAPQPVPARHEFPGARVLVVDDNVDAAQSLAMLLELMGYEAKAVYSGRAALEIAVAYDPVAIILDIGMPGMNGYEVARQLRESADSENVVLIALSGFAQDDDRSRAMRTGFDAHLVKPVELETLEALLERLAKRDRPAGDA